MKHIPRHCFTPKKSLLIINPQRMREGYGSRSVCVCYRASGYILRLYVENKVPLGFLWHFQDMHCLAFIENALLKSSDDICWPPLSSSLLDELSMDKRDSDGFFSRRLVCKSSDRSYNLTDSSLVIVNYQLRFLPWTFFVCTKSADLAYTWYCCLLRNYV